MNEKIDKNSEVPDSFDNAATKEAEHRYQKDLIRARDLVGRQSAVPDGEVRPTVDTIERSEVLDRRIIDLASASAEQLRSEASKVEPRVTGDLKDAAAGAGGQLTGLEYKIKSQASLTRKIADPLVGAEIPRPEAAVDRASARVKDTLRYTVVHETHRYMAGRAEVSSHLKARGYDMTDSKNTWSEPGDPAALPYRGINEVWTTPTGYRFELQFHTPESFQAKMDTHPAYEEVRDPQTSPRRIAQLNNDIRARSELIPVPPGAVEARRSEQR